ncbi:unnamed protein product [Clonostachys rosea]|uniref:G-protein coupled receptors family 1 profile domain-containing protein n=1 Tax=Bionectria ochroleuca TaxID=29856 RepID=A0ABY6UWK6_BIOOC|nr:unnamed protein product [Clonostachys rosea]
MDTAIATATLTGSLLSSIANAFVLVSFFIYRRQIRNFRHTLVLNLTIAEFINALNNSVSGITRLRDGQLHPGTACAIQGLLGQLSVQAADFSIFTIALVTLLVVMRFGNIMNASLRMMILVCVAIWVIPMITSTTATAMGLMTVVGGNWCWITPSRPDMRLVLTHSWRFSVIFSTVIIHIWIWVFLKWHFNSNRSRPTQPRHSARLPLISLRSSPTREMVVLEATRYEETEFSPMADDKSSYHTNMQKGREIKAEFLRHEAKELDLKIPEAAIHPTHNRGDSSRGATMRTNGSEFPIRSGSRQIEREIRRMLLLNAYPIMYVILWIPGLVGRFMEATDRPPSTRTIAALQVSTQFIGCANALTYGFDRHLRNSLGGIYGKA